MAVIAAVSLQPLMVQLRISQSRHVFLFSSFCCLFLRPSNTPRYQTPWLQFDRRRQPTSSKLLRLIISLFHSNHTNLLFSLLFSLTNLQAPQFIQTPCFFVFVPLLLPSLSKLPAFCFLSLFLLPSLPPTPSLTLFCTLSSAPQFIQAFSLSLSLSYFCVSLASSSSL